MTLSLIAVIVVSPWLGCAAFGCFVAYKIYHPYRKPSRPPEIEGLDVDAVKIPSRDGIRLDALVLNDGESKHFVLITHELGAYKESKFALARSLVSQGYGVVMFDLRNHGGSTADPAWWSMSERFTDDIEAALEFTRQRVPDLRTLTLCAFSFSTFPALYIVRRDVKQPDGIILDSGPNITIDKLFGRFLGQTRRSLIPWIFRSRAFFPLFSKVVEVAGLKMLATTWPPDLEGLQSDVLFITNELDNIFPTGEIYALSSLIGRKSHWECKGSGHLGAYRSSPARYEQAIFEFLSEVKRTR